MRRPGTPAEPESALVPLAAQGLQAEWTPPDEGEGWLVIKQGDYRTHYLCAACVADLTDLRIHYVACCPYCTAPLPFLLDDEIRKQVEENTVVLDGWSWPYDALSKRFLGWCCMYRFRSDTPPDFVDEKGNPSWVGHRCKRLDNHDGPCRFDGPKERPPLNPLRGDAR